MSTWDEAKRDRDGHLSAGRVHPSDPRTWMWPVVTAIGFTEDGRAVATMLAYGRTGGEIEYRNAAHKDETVTRWETTDKGKRLLELREDRTP